MPGGEAARAAAHLVYEAPDLSCSEVGRAGALRRWGKERGKIHAHWLLLRARACRLRTGEQMACQDPGEPWVSLGAQPPPQCPELRRVAKGHTAMWNKGCASAPLCRGQTETKRGGTGGCEQVVASTDLGALCPSLSMWLSWPLGCQHRPGAGPSPLHTATESRHLARTSG